VAALFLLFGQWETISNYWGWAWRLVARGPAAEQGVSPDTEYFCPMCPGVLSSWPSKCPVCNMPLVQRRTGEAQLLPEGVTARMQFSPYRLQLAGVRTAPVEYRRLTREVAVLGMVLHQESQVAPPAATPAGNSETVDAETIDDPQFLVEADVPLRDAALLSPGDPVEIACSELAPKGPWAGIILEIGSQVSPMGQRVRIHVECPDCDLPVGTAVQARFQTAISDVEPFRSLPRDPPSLSAGDVRTVYVCPDHPDVIAIRPGICPRDSLELQPAPLQANERVSYWCPMHPKVTAQATNAGSAKE
jgi:hypothetical protein